MTLGMDRGGLLRFYAHSKGYLIGRGYGNEIAWQESRLFDRTTESEFLREAAWVVLASGMKEKVVRQKFPAVSSAFLDWRSAEAIQRKATKCRQAALQTFNSVRKVDAILKISGHVAGVGYSKVRESIKSEGVAYIRRLPFMGPITAWHLAKNIGFPCAKPDRHLTRMAAVAGFAGVHEMCDWIAKRVGEKISVVDLVLWRYATCRPDYLTELHWAMRIEKVPLAYRCRSIPGAPAC